MNPKAPKTGDHSNESYSAVLLGSDGNTTGISRIFGAN